MLTARLTLSYQRKKLPVSFTASLTRDQIDFLRGQDYVGKVLENTGPGSAVLLSRVYDDYDPFVDGPVL